jgi:hypothetical protein
MQVIGPGGPRLHLPSLGIVVHVSLVVAGGQVAPLRVKEFFANRLFQGGRDNLQISLSATGLIQGFHLARKNESSDLSQDCGI